MNIVIKKYATFSLAIQIKDGAGESASPSPITGLDPRMQIRSDIDATEVLMDLSVANGRINVTDAENGQLELRIARSDTASIGWQSGVYDLLLIGEQDTRRILEGTVTISQGVTRI
jgi:hypothetical protein